jgi:DNA-binding response OmpR family regulator
MLFGRKQRSIERILIVEDEPLIAFDTEHVLTDDGFVVVATVDRVAHAIAALNDGGEIDMVLVDVNLADGSGIDVARAAAERGVKVMFVTGSCPVEAESIAHGCLSKPYGQRDLLDAIRAIDHAAQGRRTRRLPTGFRLFTRA